MPSAIITPDGAAFPAGAFHAAILDAAQVQVDLLIAYHNSPEWLSKEQAWFGRVEPDLIEADAHFASVLSAAGYDPRLGLTNRICGLSPH